MVPQVAYHIYSLEFDPTRLAPGASPLGPRPLSYGALLRIQWSENLIGYSDFHPVNVTSASETLKHLRTLTDKRSTPLAHQSLWFARRDAEARAKRRSLLDGTDNILNNFLIFDASRFQVEEAKKLKREKFEVVKIKIRDKPDQEIRLIQELAQLGFLLRLDANSQMTFKEFLNFCTKIGKEARKQIQYCEDPFPFSASQWGIAKEYLPLAADQEKLKIDWNLPHPPVQNLILKPATEDVELVVEIARLGNMGLTITGSFDHPIGNLHALALAAELQSFHQGVVLSPGLLTYRFFKPNLFSEYLSSSGPFLRLDERVQGWGVGFDKELQQLQWTQLN